MILIAKKFSLLIDASLSAAGAPPALSGIIVALIVLAPESIAALQVAKRNLLKKSVNLALGSALATIGLTIPAVAVTSLLLGKPLQMGLNQRDIVLLVLTLFVSVLTFGTGRTNVLSGLGHLVIFATFLELVFLP
ncbi:MAG: hypothetical protein MO853_00945 [Candidatus Protistobacter heckmanni]|nr:hypothetical protein [Candidatus Protistobacter heckmanni]